MNPLQANLTEQQIAVYQQAGSLVLRSVFTIEEIGMLAAEAESLVARTELIDTQYIRCRWSDHHVTNECTFDCFDPVIDIAPVCRYFAYDDRILSVLRTLFVTDAIEPETWKALATRDSGEVIAIEE